MAAKQARRLADIAKHKPIPLDELDAYGDDCVHTAIKSQVRLFELGLDLQNAYADLLGPMRDAIKRLRNEALYWRERFNEQEKS